MEAHWQSLLWGKPASTKLMAKGQLPTSGWKVRTWDKLGTRAGGTWHTGQENKEGSTSGHQGWHFVSIASPQISMPNLVPC